MPDWGLRPDGTPKGEGFLGPLALPNGYVASEFSVADSEHLKDAKGNHLDYPTLVPTLTRDEVQAVLRSAATKDTNKPVPLPDSVYDKAEAHALERKRQGLPLFAGPGEQRLDLHPDLPREHGQNQNRYGDLFGLSKATGIGQGKTEVMGRPIPPPGAMGAARLLPGPEEATTLEETAMRYGKDVGGNLLSYIAGKLREMAQQQGLLPTRSQVIEKLTGKK